MFFQEIADFTSQFISQDNLESKPLKGLRVGVIRETIEDGVDPEVISSIRGAASHLEELGCTVTEVFFSYRFLYLCICTSAVAIFRHSFLAHFFLFSFSIFRSPCHLFLLDYQLTTYLRHLNLLQIYLVMILSGHMKYSFVSVIRAD